MGCIMAYYRNITSLTPIECIQKLREMELILTKMLDRYRSEAVESKEMARNYVRDDQPILAKACLKRCKMLDHQMASIVQRISNCEAKRLAIENMESMSQQVQLTRETTRTFKSFLRKHDIDKIESLQDTLKQAILESCDISDVLQEELTPMLDDEDELENELKSMMLSESIRKSFPSTPEVHVQFPRVPQTKPEKKSARPPPVSEIF